MLWNLDAAFNALVHALLDATESIFIIVPCRLHHSRANGESGVCWRVRYGNVENANSVVWIFWVDLDNIPSVHATSPEILFLCRGLCNRNIQVWVARNCLDIYFQCLIFDMIPSIFFKIQKESFAIIPQHFCCQFLVQVYFSKFG